MKIVKNKRSNNSSFLSNHDLLQNFRNKSFKLITRDASLNDIKSLTKKVSLIQKKSYENILKVDNTSIVKDKRQNKQNDPLHSNRKNFDPSKITTYRQIGVKQSENQLNKIIRQLNFVYDQISPTQIELRMILNKNIRKIKQLFSEKYQIPNSAENSTGQLLKEMKQKMQFLQKKTEDQSKNNLRYKKQNHELKENIQLCQTRIQLMQEKHEQLLRKCQQNQSLHKRNKGGLLNNEAAQLNQIELRARNNNKQAQPAQKPHIKQSPSEFASQSTCPQPQLEILQSIIQSQQQLLTRLSLDFTTQTNQLYTILSSQASHIQQLLLNSTRSLGSPQTSSYAETHQGDTQGWSNRGKGMTGKGGVR